MAFGHRNLSQKFVGRIGIIETAGFSLRGLSVEQKKSLQYGRFSNGFYFPIRRDAGFFSLCSTSLLDLTQINSHVDGVKGRKLFRDYVSKTQLFADTWSMFFNQPNARDSELPEDRSQFTELHHHSVYQQVNLASYAPFLRTYFSPSQRVLDRKAHLIQKYSIDLSATIAVNIRGTDKHTEIEAPDISTYLDLASESLSKEPGKRILLVTDQRQFLDVFKTTFKSSFVCFDELPTTYGDVVIHKQLKKNQRDEFGLNFLSTVLVISQAQEVITHTGNGALWTSLFRGGTVGLTQLRGKEVFIGSR